MKVEITVDEGHAVSIATANFADGSSIEGAGKTPDEALGHCVRELWLASVFDKRVYLTLKWAEKED